MTGRLLSKIIWVALLHIVRLKVIIMGRTVDNFRHSIMIVYMALKLSSVGGAFMIGRDSMTNLSMPDSSSFDFIKPFHDGCLSIGRFSYCFETHPINHATSPGHEVTVILNLCINVYIGMKLRQVIPLPLLWQYGWILISSLCRSSSFSSIGSRTLSISVSMAW